MALDSTNEHGNENWAGLDGLGVWVKNPPRDSGAPALDESGYDAVTEDIDNAISSLSESFGAFKDSGDDEFALEDAPETGEAPEAAPEEAENSDAVFSQIFSDLSDLKDEIGAASEELKDAEVLEDSPQEPLSLPSASGPLEDSDFEGFQLDSEDLGLLPDEIDIPKIEENTEPLATEDGLSPEDLEVKSPEDDPSPTARVFDSQWGKEAAAEPGPSKGLHNIPAQNAPDSEPLPENLKDQVKEVLSYMDQLLENLPEEKIEEFAKSPYFKPYKNLFEELGIS